MKVSAPSFMVNRALPFLLVGIAACSGDGPTAIEIPILRIDITQGCSVVIEGDRCQIVAVAFGEGDRPIANPILRYISTSPAADVSSRGLVTGRVPGSTTIFVTNSTGSVSDQTRVTVLPRSNK